MISKVIIIGWTVVCIMATYQVLMEHAHGHITEQTIDGYALIAGFLWWGFVAVPVALVGLLFKRRH